MFLSQCKAPAQQRVTVSKFLGYDARPRTPLGAFARMENLTGDGYPTLSVREKRKTIAALDKPNGLCAKDCLIWVDGGTLYINGAAIDLTLTDGEKQLVSMGAYLLIWPDKKYVNTQDLSDKGSLENTRQTTGTVTFALCRSDGTEYEDYTAGAAAPTGAESGDLWLDTGSGAALMRYDGVMWQAVDDAAMKISAAGIGLGFSAGDGVTVSGCTGAAADGTWTLLQCGDDAIVIGAVAAIEGEQTTAVTVRRYVPDMDFVVECGNRLWGCKYGIVDGQTVNAVYGSALGDFRNWNAFAGLSTDSYAADRGSDGVFTGATAYLGTVLFFKEHSMERLYISAAGAHQITSLQCPGVKQGSSRSLAVADGVLYFHGSGGVYAFDGVVDEDGKTSVSMTMESFYEKARDADYIIYNASIDSSVKTIEDLIKKDEVLKEFKAVKNGACYTTGSSMYQRTDVIANMILDFHKVFTGQDTDQLEFLEKMKESE